MEMTARKASQLLQSQKFWLALIVGLTAVLIAGITHSLRTAPEHTVRSAQLPLPELPTLSRVTAGHQVASLALQQYADLQQKALQGVGMSQQDREAYAQATANIAQCTGPEADQVHLADCLGDKLRFLLQESMPQ